MQRGRVYTKAEFGRLFMENYQRFFYCALDLVEDHETARDIVGDVTYETWLRIGEITASDPDVNISGYMLNAIRNRSLNVLRHKAVENAYLREALAAKEEISSEPEDRHEEQLRRLQHVMESLEPQTMQIFRMCWFEGKKYKEVAEELGVTVSLVHKKVSKAFAAFRASFGVKTSVLSVTILIAALLIYKIGCISAMQASLHCPRFALFSM